MALEAGLFPDFVGVLGVFPVACLPAAGDGAMLWDVWAVCGVLEVEDWLLVGGDILFGVGGKE